MPSDLSLALAHLLDSSASLGVGVGDSSGLLVESQGAHAGHPPEAFVSALSHCRPAGLGPILGDALDEHTLLGERYCVYVHWFGDGAYFVYALAPRERAGLRLRRSLRTAVAQLGAVLTRAPRQRLEQPRQFPGVQRVR